MTRGIDYSGSLGTCNRDPETGIRYGIVPLHSLGEFAFESFEPEYDNYCPKCGNELPESFDNYGDDPTCPHCGEDLRGCETIADEPSRNVLNDGEYEGFLDSSSDAWFTKSPYYTRAAFCSPCAPGACYLTSPCDDGERAYCPGPEWFDEHNPAPFPIYRVSDDERAEVKP